MSAGDIMLIQTGKIYVQHVNVYIKEMNGNNAFLNYKTSIIYCLLFKHKNILHMNYKCIIII